MRSCILLIALGLLAAIFPMETSAQMANIRGQIRRLGPAGVYGVANVRVTLYSQALGLSAPSFTGFDGMYYLYNIPAGSYFLQVWANPVNPNSPLAYPIQVFAPSTDIPVVTLP
jgi:hypothetical protein